MDKKILLSLIMTCFITMLFAQSNKSTSVYAITSAQKGQSSWKEIKLIDIKTGETQNIYSSTQEIEILNARTGKAVQKKDSLAKTAQTQNKVQVYIIDADNKAQLVSNNEDLQKLRESGKRVIVINNADYNEKLYDKPFATNSAALAFDKKHERLYYTPMGINQLRYIDLKSKTPKIYYFEDEPFGKVSNIADVPNQLTRMVIASDGNGYALSNNAEHLLQFTTGKKPVITDLGAITDDAGNGDFSIHRGVGGDMIADKSGNLYLITAYKNVWKINIKSKVATYKGGIKGIPDGYQTNGAVVEEGSKIIVCSGTSTEGYYHFDLNTLQAEKLSSTGEVYNASDLANGNLAFDERKKDESITEQPAQAKEESIVVKQDEQNNIAADNGILVYPNPVTDRTVRLSFNNQPTGKYTVQFMDMTGKTLSNQTISITGKSQVQEIRFPSLIVSGTYLVKVISEDNKTNLVSKLTVQ